MRRFFSGILLSITMKLVLQRVSNASVSVDGKSIGSIDRGYVILVGIGVDDLVDFQKKTAFLIDKVLKLRLFESDGKTFDKSLNDCGGDILVVSQFTLYADCLRGKRPSFDKSLSPDSARPIYESFVSELKKVYEYSAISGRVVSGIFGAHMNISLENDGPVTIILEA